MISQQTPVYATRQRLVLVAEETETTSRQIDEVLTKSGHRVLHAQTGESPLFQVLQRDVDAILVSTSLPGIGGVELCERLRALERYRMVPLIFLTPSSDNPDLFKVLDAGADDFIVKPIKPLILRTRLRGYLERVSYLEELEDWRANLNRYVSDRTQAMVATYTATGVLPPAQEQQLTVMFADVRGFTSMSQEMESGLLFTILSSHLAMQVDTVYRHGGYVDKFGGDGIMAIFDSVDSSGDACMCALDIIDATRRGRGQAGAPILPLGSGINYGSVHVGNIGSNKHLDYSAIGETVNLAARLCGFANAMSIIASESVMDKVGIDERLQFKGRRKVDIRGMREEVAVYDVLRTTGIHARPSNTGITRYEFDRRQVWDH